MSDLENKGNKHLDEITLLLYVERQLDRESAQEVSLHTQTCTLCMTLLRALDRESRLLTRSMLEQDEPIPARLAEFHEKVKESMQWIWGVFFGLAALGAYALYNDIVEPWELRLEQAGFGGSNLLSLLLFQGALWKGWQSMLTLVEFVALASVTGFGLFLFRRYLKRGAAVAVMFASLGLLTAVATPTLAQEIRIDKKGGESFEVKKDETLNKDLFFSGQRLRVAGTVDGDVYAFGQQVDVSGHVTGDVICFAQTARITGQVDGNVRSFTNNITISGIVDKNVSAFNQVLNLDSNGRIGRSMALFTETGTLDGKIGRDFRGFFKEATISGTIGGDMKAKGESLTIASSAEIGGKAVFEGAKPADVASGAKLASPLEFKQMEHGSRRERGGGFYIWKVVWAGARILFGLVLISLMPIFAKESVESAEQYGASLGLGVLVFFGVFIAAFIACITIVGLLLGVSTLFLWTVVLFSSYVVVGAVIGRWLFGKDNQLWPLVGRMAVGVLIVMAATSIPHLGFWVMLAVWIWGMGAVSLALYRRLQPVIAPTIPSMPPMQPLGGAPLPPNTTVSGI